MLKEESRITGKINLTGSSASKYFIKRNCTNNSNLFSKTINCNNKEYTNEMNEKEIEVLLENTDKIISNEWITALSHEFRTPLNVILSTIQVALLNTDGNQESEYRQVKSKYLHIMRQNCLRLMKMINNLIDINRIESEFFSIDPTNEDIVSIIWQITNSVSEYAGAKNIKISFETNKQECVIACDTFQLERILLNLLSNAIKFTPTGGRIKVELVVMPEKVYVSVSDTGQGIHPKYQKVIFERFRQTDCKSFIEKKGSGMGLYLVKKLLDKMNGKIWINSKEGEGSKFTFFIPNYTIPQTVKEKKRIGYVNNRVEYLQIEFSDIYVN